MDKEHKVGKLKEGNNKQCSYCDHRSMNWFNLKVHIDYKHPEHREKTIKCDKCGQGFMFEEACHRHQLKHHNVKVCCEICGLELFNKKGLEDHMDAKHNTKEKTLVCKECDFSTYAKTIMKSHINRIHRIENHKKCYYCDYSAYNISKFQYHIDSRHPEHGEKNFSCNHCSRRFIYETSLKQHLANVKYGPKNVERKRLKKEMMKSFKVENWR